MSSLSWIILFITAPFVASQDLQTVTIWQRNDVKVLRPCVQNCLWGYGDVAPKAGCVAPHYNQCWCSAANIAPSATRWISSCATSLCSDNVDVATAIDIYYDYCSGAGHPIPNTVAKAVAASVDTKTVTIWGRNDYKVFRPCVQTCLWGYGDVAPKAGCVTPHYNQCWCSSNIAVSATKYISSCVTNLCSDSFDVSSAVDIYANYCSAAGHPIDGQSAQVTTAPMSTPAKTTSSASSITSPGSSQAKVGSSSLSTSRVSSSTATLSTSEQTTSSSSSPYQPSSEGTKLTGGQIVGIVGGILATIALGLTLVYFLVKKNTLTPPKPKPALPFITLEAIR